VRETDLVLTMAERYARLLNADFKNKILPLPIEVPTLDSYLYWHASARQRSRQSLAAWSGNRGLDEKYRVAYCLTAEL
jgi:hypothetical protein